MRKLSAFVAIGLLVPMPAMLSAQSATQSDEIVVLAHKLQAGRLALKIGRKNGVIYIKSCKLAGSTGDPEVDLIGCGAVEKCVEQKLTKKRDLGKCTNERSFDMLEELVKSRAEMRDSE